MMLRFQPSFCVVLIALTGSLSFAQEDRPIVGKVATIRRTLLKDQPKAQAHTLTSITENTELPWIMGQTAGKFVRVIIPKGPTGWVLKSDIKIIENAPLTDLALQAQAQPCASSLSECISSKPVGCAAPGSAHALANKQKRSLPTGAAIDLSFESFSQLQEAANSLVDQGTEIDDRSPLGSISISEGTVGEGSNVRLVAFLSEGKPHANTGESVNCNLHGPSNNDFHISVTDSPNGSEFEGLVVEMVPQDRPSTSTLTNLAKIRKKMLLIEGGLFYDNLHFVNGDADNPMPGGQPKRFSLWEIHPITSVKVCKKANNQCDPAVASDWRDF